MIQEIFKRYDECVNSYIIHLEIFLWIFSVHFQMEYFSHTNSQYWNMAMIQTCRWVSLLCHHLIDEVLLQTKFSVIDGFQLPYNHPHGLQIFLTNFHLQTLDKPFFFYSRKRKNTFNA